MLVVAVGVVGANSLGLSPIVGAVAASFDGATSADVVRASGVFGLTTALSALFAAPQVDRIGAAHALLAALVVLAVALILSLGAQSVMMLSLAQGLAGVASGVALPATYALAASIAPKGKEAQTLGLVLTGWTLCLVTGVTISALIADFYHWRLVYSLLTLLTLAALTGIWRVGFVNQRGAVAVSPITALRVPGVVRALIPAFLYMLAFYGVYNFVGAHVHDVLGYNTSAAGMITLSYGIGFGLSVSADKMMDRMGLDMMRAPVFAALTITYLVLTLVMQDLPMLVGLSFFWGFFNHMGLNLLVARLAEIDPAKRGAILGLYSAVSYFAVSFGVWVFAPVFAGRGLQYCALIAAVCLAVATIDAWISRRRRNPVQPNISS